MSDNENEEVAQDAGEEEAPAADSTDLEQDHAVDEGQEVTGDQEPGDQEKSVAGPSTDSNEAKKAMEEAKRARAEKQTAEMAEYEASRAEARDKEEEEIRLLREKRLQRQREREEEEKRLTEMRAAEEVKRKAEEEERRRKKLEEEQRLKDERERKRKEAEERLRPKGRNFTIIKKSDSDKVLSSVDAVMTSEDLQKSKEQLEEEKRAILAQRIQPLSVDGLEADKLVEKAKEIQEQIRRLEGDRYDLEQRYKRQQYDMIELAERARQMNKGKGKRGVKTVQVDESFDRLADKYTSAPPKIQLCSKYERHTDNRTYSQRITLFEEKMKEQQPTEFKRVGKAAETVEEEEKEEEEEEA